MKPTHIWLAVAVVMGIVSFLLWRSWEPDIEPLTAQAYAGPLRVADLSGKPAVLAFTDCNANAFREGVDEINRLHEEYSNRAAVYVLSTTDARSCAESFALRPDVLRISEEAAREWGATPHRIFVLQADSRTAWKSAPGAFPAADARRQLAMLFAGEPVGQTADSAPPATGT